MNRELPDEVLRGQMYYADLDPVIGSEQGGNRPVLVIQNNIGNRHSPTIIIAPITTRVKKLHQPTHIGVPPYFGLPQNSMVMLEQIRTIDKSRLGSYVGCFDDDVMDYVDEALGISVGLHDLAGKEQKPYADESHDEMHGEMVLTLCGTCLRQFICSPEHIVRRINHAQAKEPCMYCHVRDGYDYRIIHKKKHLGDDRYYGVNTWAPSTFDGHTALISNYIKPIIGDVKLDDISPRMITKFYKDLQTVKAVPRYGKPEGELISPNTIREIHKLLRNAFNQAVKWELMARNPVQNATVPKAEKHERNIWDAQTLMKALSLCDDPFLALAINLAFACSLRMGELLGLTWSCVDISQDSIDHDCA